MPLSRLLSKLLGLTLTGSGFSASLLAAPAAGEVKVEIAEKRWSYESGGRTIRVDTFLSAGERRCPAVLVLYGSGGALLGKGEMVKVSRRLAERGMAAFLVHYFQRTGTVVARDPAIYRHWPTWAETVRDGVDAVAAHPRVDAARLGMFGYSLGGFLAVAESTTDARIDAVAEVSGGVFDGVAGDARRFPRLLILHGRDDERVPFAPNFARLKGMAGRFHATPKVKTYEGQGHSFTKDYAADAGARAVEFLEECLAAKGAEGGNTPNSKLRN